MNFERPLRLRRGDEDQSESGFPVHLQHSLPADTRCRVGGLTSDRAHRQAPAVRPRRSSALWLLDCRVLARRGVRMEVRPAAGRLRGYTSAFRRGLQTAPKQGP